MELNDFIGSFAQENVDFTTRVIKTASVGQNFWTTMIFVENDRFITADSSLWEDVKGSTNVKVLAVDASTYAEYTSGLLRSWLYDLFVNGNANECYLVLCGEKLTTEALETTFITNMTEAYNLLKAYAYHKTACVIKNDYTGEAGAETDLDLNTTVLVELGKLMAPDYALLSGVPLVPFALQNPTAANFTTDLVYAAFVTAKVDAFMSAHQDTTRNASLYSLGLALSKMDNGSGTPVGNNFDMWKSLNITSSGAQGSTLDRTIRRVLNRAHIQTWKPVGNNTGAVAAENAVTLNGDVYQAIWIKAYITYMTKVQVADIMTEPNFIRSPASYGAIITIMVDQISKFTNSGRLVDVELKIPAFEQLPESSTEIIIQDIWSGVYADVVRRVAISGALYISSDAGLAA